MLKVELLTGKSLFDDLKSEWDALIDPRRAESLFMTREWQALWWRHLGWGSLFTLTARDETGKLIGLAPCFIDDERSIQLIGSADVADYLDVLILPGMESAVWARWIDALTIDHADKWDAINLCNLPSDSSSLSILPALAKQFDLETSVTVQDVCPKIDLPGGFDQYLRTLHRSRRHSLRRKRKTARIAGTVWQRTRDAKRLLTFCDLMRSSLAEKASFLERQNMLPFFQEMGETMLDNGCMELCFLTLNGEDIASVWQFARGDSVMFYNSGWDPRYAHLSPGVVLLSLCIEDAIERGFKTYDFLRGHEDYKYRLGGRDRAVYNLKLIRDSAQTS
jgi:CelD/BcsL family acetyltransferase involved in cellulose biosynthesis